MCFCHVACGDKQCCGNVEIKQETKKKLGEGGEGGVSNITKMPLEERQHGEFHSAASSTSSEHTAVATVKECHSALHLYFNNCLASSVSQSVGWLVQSSDHTDAPHKKKQKQEL